MYRMYLFHNENDTVLHQHPDERDQNSNSVYDWGPCQRLHGKNINSLQPIRNSQTI